MVMFLSREGKLQASSPPSEIGFERANQHDVAREWARVLEDAHFNIYESETTCFQAFELTPDTSISETRRSHDPMGAKTLSDRAGLPNFGYFGLPLIFNTLLQTIN